MEEKESYHGLTVTVRLDDVDDLSKVLSDLKAALNHAEHPFTISALTINDVAKEVTEHQVRDVSEQLRKQFS